MTKLAAAIAMALGCVASAQAGNYVVIAHGNAFDAKMASDVAKAGGRITARLPQIGAAFVEADDGFAARAEKITGVRSAVNDVVLQFDVPAAESVDEDFANPPASGDNDTRFDLQWGHAAIDAAGAWNLGHRGNGVRVAVLDSGVACIHPDIAPNLDTAASTSFVANEGPCLSRIGAFNHGSHVAGTIASPDNGFGTIGVAPQAKIIAVKVLSETTGSGSFSGIINGIVYAADAGADVINMSLGVRGGLDIGGKDTAELWNLTGRAVRYARSQNALTVVSAGNDGRDLDHDSGNHVPDGLGGVIPDNVNLRSFPGQLQDVLTISATAPTGWAKAPFATNYDGRASYTNYGQSAIDFAGPGGDSAYPGNESCTMAGLLRPCWVFDLVFSVGGYAAGPNGSILASYSWTAGTSMAAPHVSGVAALIIGKHGGEMAPAAVERILRASSDDLGKTGNDDTFGAGRVNAARAVL